MSEFSTKLERSSLGTRSAKAARKTVPREVATKLVARAGKPDQKTTSKRSGG